MKIVKKSTTLSLAHAPRLKQPLRVAYGVLVIIVVSVASSSVFGQNTWNNLHFGSSLAEVGKSLTPQGLTLRQNTDCTNVSACKGRWIVQPGWDLKLADNPIKKVYHFKPELTFSDEDKLVRVHLWYEDDNPTTGQSLDRYSAVTSLEEQLIAKYGTAATRTGICSKVEIYDFINAREMECEALWKAEGQAVKFGWLYVGRGVAIGTLSIEITYTISQSSGL